MIIYPYISLCCEHPLIGELPDLQNIYSYIRISIHPYIQISIYGSPMKYFKPLGCLIPLIYRKRQNYIYSYIHISKYPYIHISIYPYIYIWDPWNTFYPWETYNPLYRGQARYIIYIHIFIYLIYVNSIYPYMRPHRYLKPLIYRTYLRLGH